MLKICKFILLILMIPSAIYSQEIQLLPGETLPELHGVKVAVSVAYDFGSELYTYAYAISNLASNTGAIDDLEIDITSPKGSINLSRTGLKYGQGYLESSSSAIASKLSAPLIPVGVSAPMNWVVGVTVRGTVSWSAVEDNAPIRPGSSVSQFEMNTRGLPGIREFIIMPEFKQQPVDEATQENLDRLNAIEKRIAFKGRTVGPTAPPANFKPVEFLDYIVSLKKDAYYQGWIIQKNEGRDRDCDKDRGKDRDKKEKNGNKNDKCKDNDRETGIMNSLDKKLGHARAELVRGDNRGAIEKLKAFMHEVAALYKEGKEIRHSHITSEAFALLYYNAEYLVGQLDGDKKYHHHRHHKDRRD